ncbi:protein CCSMST1 [Apus apus]|uniref:protein CCSMST1 n=1 Tax=Apus apus TaxID=8895 RepID=UPI0021F86365|nr:protein CCSMST1 [Apus apus]
MLGLGHAELEDASKYSIKNMSLHFHAACRADRGSSAPQRCAPPSGRRPLWEAVPDAEAARGLAQRCSGNTGSLPKSRRARRAAGGAAQQRPPPRARSASGGGMSWALGRARARRCLRLLGPRRGLARRGPPGSDPEDGGALPFSGSKASPRVWSVGRSMGSDHERPWAKVLPLSLLCAGLLLWCVLREKTEVDERLEAAFSGPVAGSSEAAPGSSAALRGQD